VRAAMSKVRVALGGVRGGDLTWTDTNHFRAVQFYRVWHWSDRDGKVVVAQDWKPYDVK
jgi:hypothetical protein